MHLFIWCSLYRKRCIICVDKKNAFFELEMLQNKKWTWLQRATCCSLSAGWMCSTICTISTGGGVNHLQSFVAVTSPSVWNCCESSIFIPVALFAPYSSILAVRADITVTLATVWANRVCKSMWRDADDSVKGGAEETWKGWTLGGKVSPSVWSGHWLVSRQSCLHRSSSKKKTNQQTHTKHIKHKHSYHMSSCEPQNDSLPATKTLAHP